MRNDPRDEDRHQAELPDVESRVEHAEAQLPRRLYKWIAIESDVRATAAETQANVGTRTARTSHLLDLIRRSRTVRAATGGKAEAEQFSEKSPFAQRHAFTFLTADTSILPQTVAQNRSATRRKAPALAAGSTQLRHDPELYQKLRNGRAHRVRNRSLGGQKPTRLP